MRWSSFLVLQAILITACGETPVATDDSDLAKGGGPPTTGNITVVNLGFAVATDIDEEGRIVGWRETRTVTRAVLWAPTIRRGTTGSAGDLPAPVGGATYAVGMNEAQQVAGVRSNADLGHAVLWSGGVFQVLGDGVALGSAADDVSDPSGTGTRFVVGHLEEPFHAAVWRVSGSGGVSGPEQLPTMDQSGGQAIAASSSGMIVGDVESPSNPIPVKWTESTSGWQVSPLALLPGANYGQALDVNEGGAAVGFNGASSGCSRGVAWTPPSYAAIPLQDLAGGVCSWAWAINGEGQITGNARDSRGRHQAVLWTPLATGGYSILSLGGLKSTAWGDGRGLNEPEADASGVRSVEVAGISGGRATLWKVKLP